MSSSVCQGWQSHLEMVESCFLKMKLAPPIKIFNEETNSNIINNNRNADEGGWTFLRSFSDAKAPAENEKVYVHPLVKCSASRISEKSLEMCTERLGSETGSEVSDCSDDICLLSLEIRTVACDKARLNPRESSLTRKTSRGNSFPPPLTSISGSNGVRVKSHRENGRLVLEAVSFHPCHSYFHAERSDGRLRLSLFKDAAADEQEYDEEEEFDGETENNVGGELGTGKFPRPSSCKESGCGHKGGGLLNWKPYLVAT